MKQSIFHLSLCNFKARLRRTLLNILLITTATTGLMTIAGFGLFTYVSLEQRSARETGHLVLSNPLQFAKPENRLMEHGLENLDAVKKELFKNSDVLHALPVINFQGLIANDNKSVTFLGRGIDPKEITVRGPFINLIKGSSINYKYNSQDDPEVMLGKGLAKNLSVKIGDYLTLLSNTVDDSLNGFDVKVVGISETGIPEIDNRTLFTHYQTAQDLLSTDKVNQVAIYLKELSFLQRAGKKITSAFQDLKVTYWDELAVFYQGVKNLYNTIFYFVGSITFVIIFFAVFNLISTSIWERTREFGVLASLGFAPKEIMLSLLLESTLIGLISMVFATIIYGGVSVALLFSNIMMAPPPGQTTGYPLQVIFSGEIILYIALITFFIVQLSTFLASTKINKLSITQSLMHL